VATQIVAHKQQHPEHGIKRIAQIFRRFLGLEVSVHQVRKALRNVPGTAGTPAKRKMASGPPELRFFERHAPNELWHTDVMYYRFKGMKLFLLGYLDDYSRYVVGLAAFHSQTVGHTLDLLKQSCNDYHYPREILTDGGRQFCSWTGKSQFGTFLRQHEVKHTVCRPHHPQTNGKLERFWHTLRVEFLDKAHCHTFEELNEQLGCFVQYYNFRRPHQGIGGMTPADRFFEVESEVKKQLAQQVKDNALELALRGRIKNPFYMVGRIGEQNVAIREEKGRLSLQLDGVPCPTDRPIEFNLLADRTLNAAAPLANIINQEDINHEHGNDGKHGGGNDHAPFGAGDHGENPAGGDPAGREMQSGVGALDGNGKYECGLPPVGDCPAATDPLGGPGVGGDAQGAGGTAGGQPSDGRTGVVAPVDQIVGETAAAPAGTAGGAGNQSGESRPQTPSRSDGAGPWKVNADCRDCQITV
jgi:transposase InsO family protein